VKGAINTGVAARVGISKLALRFQHKIVIISLCLLASDYYDPFHGRLSYHFSQGQLVVLDLHAQNLGLVQNCLHLQPLFEH